MKNLNRREFLKVAGLGAAAMAVTPELFAQKKQTKPDFVMDFSKIVQPVPRTAAFSLDGYGVWGHSITRTDDGTFHMYFSYVPDGKRHENSEVGYATSNSPTGPYTYQGKALAHGKTWDSGYVHSTSIFQHEKKFYLYYTAAADDIHMNKWVGVAISNDPAGPWKRFDKPLIDRTIDPEAVRVTSNPSAIIGPNGKIWVFYTCRADGGVIHAAESDDPAGPFTKVEGVTGIGSFKDNIRVEDGVVWHYRDRYYFIVKDKPGYYNKTGVISNSLFESADAKIWTPCPNPRVMKNPREITWKDGSREVFQRLERAQIWWDETARFGVLCLVAKLGSLGTGQGKGCYNAVNIQVPLRIDY